MTTTNLTHDTTGWTAQDWCDQLADLACIGGATISLDWNPDHPGVVTATVSNNVRQETRQIPTPRIAQLLSLATHCTGTMVFAPYAEQAQGASRLHGQTVGLARELADHYAEVAA